MTTPGDGKYSRTCFTIYNRNHVILRIRACSDALIALSQYVGTTNYETVEINIGAQQNSATYIRSSVGGTIVAQADTPNILSCLYDRYFWIGWTNTTISVGRNTQAFNGAVVTWMNTIVKSITGVCISNDVNPGTWAVNSLPGEHTNS
jgi:hypothetical protein